MIISNPGSWENPSVALDQWLLVESLTYSTLHGTIWSSLGSRQGLERKKSSDIPREADLDQLHTLTA